MSISADAKTPRQLQEMIRDTLAASSYFPEHGVKILLQDEGEIRYTIDKTASAITKPVLIIAVTEVTPNQPDISAELQIVIIENVTANRSRTPFATAMDVAWQAALLLDGKTFHAERLTHAIDATGLFTATLVLHY